MWPNPYTFKEKQSIFEPDVRCKPWPDYSKKQKVETKDDTPKSVNEAINLMFKLEEPKEEEEVAEPKEEVTKTVILKLSKNAKRKMKKHGKIPAALKDNKYIFKKVAIAHDFNKQFLCKAFPDLTYRAITAMVKEIKEGKF